MSQLVHRILSNIHVSIHFDLCYRTNRNGQIDPKTHTVMLHSKINLGKKKKNKVGGLILPISKLATILK